MGAKVTARIKIKGKHYETNVDLDEALKIKAGKGDIMAALTTPHIFTDVKIGNKATEADLIEAFGTTDAYEIARKIIVSGEVQKTQEFRENERDTRVKQIVGLIIQNAVDQNGRPYTEERIRRAIEEVHYNFDNKPAEQQMRTVVEQLQKVIPIRIETKRIKLKIPARYTGQVYGMLKDIKESEEWLPNGDLETVINIPSGLQLDFYDKLNSATHGAVQSEELKKE